MRTALLMIHGFLTATDDWDLFVPALKDNYDEVALFRQPGHAREGEKPDYKSFTADAAFAELDRMLEVLAEYDAVDIVGHSMGGGMALYAAAKLKNARRVVALAPAFRYLNSCIISRKNTSVHRLRNLAKDCSDPAFAAALTEQSERVAKMYSKGVKMFRTRLFPHWSPHNLLTFVRIMKRAEKQLGGVTCPVVVLWGNLDEFVTRKAAEVVLNRVASEEKQLVIYDDIGHGMMYDGNAPIIIRDVAAALEGQDLRFVPTGAAEFRTAVRFTPDGRSSVRHYAEKCADGVVREIRRKLEYPQDGECAEKYEQRRPNI